jgi:membrane fusion protein (multidrug efflux system)
MSAEPMKKELKMATGIILAGIIISLIAYIANSNNSSYSANEDLLPEVTVEQLKYINIPLTVSSYAEVISPSSVALRAQASGILSNITFKPGQYVKQGQVLFTLQSRDTSGQFQQLQSKLDLARETYQRKLKLSESSKGLISEIELLQAKSQYHQVLALYRQSKNVHSIVSPIDGAVSDTDFAIGDFVESGTLLANITSLKQLQIIYELPNQYIKQVRIGQKVIFQPFQSDQHFTATVSYISPACSASDYSLTIRADLPAADIVPHIFGEAIQTIDPNHQTLAIPQEFVETDTKGFYVHVVEQDKLAKHYFFPGSLTSSGLIQVQSGIEAGTNIITSNSADLSLGEKLKVIKK